VDVAEGGGRVDRQQQEQFRDFTLARWPTLLRTAILLSPDQRRAELLVQRTLVLVHRDWEHSDRRAAPEAWARSVLVRLSLEPTEGTGPATAGLTATPQDTAPDTGRSTHEAARSERLAAAVVALPPRMRAALVLRLFDELSEGDTARALRCPVPAVSGLVSEGLSRLEVAVAPERRGEEHRR
jgi:DNA-directed RNA polymerase specialized sigma24 family protein